MSTCIMRNIPESVTVVVGIVLGVMALFLGVIFQFFFVIIIVWILFEYDAKFHELQTRLTEIEKNLAKEQSSQAS